MTSDLTWLDPGNQLNVMDVQFASGPLQDCHGSDGNIPGFYEGSDNTNSPNGASFYAVIGKTVITGGITELTTAGNLFTYYASGIWQTLWSKDPQYASFPYVGGAASQTYYIYPWDYLGGSTAASTYVLSVLRGQHEQLTTGGFSGVGLAHIKARAQSGTAAPWAASCLPPRLLPSARTRCTHWPRGSFLRRRLLLSY